MSATDPGAGECVCPTEWITTGGGCMCYPTSAHVPTEPDAGDVEFERLLGEWQRGEIPVDVVLSRLAAVRREAEVKALTEAADFIEQTSGIGALADDYTDGWYGALAYAIGDLRDRAARLGGA